MNLIAILKLSLAKSFFEIIKKLYQPMQKQFKLVGSTNPKTFLYLIHFNVLKSTNVNNSVLLAQIQYYYSILSILYQL